MRVCMSVLLLLLFVVIVLFLCLLSSWLCICTYRALPLFAWHRQAWSLLRPFLRLTDIEIQECVNAGVYVAGFTGLFLFCLSFLPSCISIGFLYAYANGVCFFFLLVFVSLVLFSLVYMHALGFCFELLVFFVSFVICVSFWFGVCVCCI